MFVPFANRSGFLLTDDAMRAGIMRLLQEQLGQMVVFRWRHCEEAGAVQRNELSGTLSRHAHLACLRSCGNRCLLLLTRLEYSSCCVFVDRKTRSDHALPRMVAVHLRFDSELFDNTVFDGELVQGVDGAWVFLVNDLLVLRNDPLNSTNLVKRLERLHSIFCSQFAADEADCCALQVKSYVPYAQLRELVKTSMHHLPYACTGIVFRPMFKRFRDVIFDFPAASKPLPQTRRTRKLAARSTLPTACEPAVEGAGKGPLAEEDPEDRTRIFYVCRTSMPDVYELREHDPITGRLEGHAAVATLELSQALRTALAGPCNSLRCTCRWCPRFGRWVPMLHGAEMHPQALPASASTPAPSGGCSPQAASPPPDASPPHVASPPTS